MRRRAVRALPGRSLTVVLAALAIGVVAWAALAHAITAFFFDQPLPPGDVLSAAMGGVAFDGRLTEVRFVFAPRERARTLHILLGCQPIERACSALRLSAIPGLPSALFRLEGGWPVETTAFADPWGATPREALIRFAADRFELEINGAPVAAAPLRGEDAALSFAAYPARLGDLMAPALSSVRSCRVAWRTAGGALRTAKALPGWLRDAGAIGGALVLLAALWLADRLLASLAELLHRQSRPRAAWLLLNYPFLLLVAMLGLVLYGGWYEHARRTDPRTTWFAGHVRGGHFDAASFLADPVLRRGGHERKVDLAPDVRRVMVFGGSTAYSFPEAWGPFDWPTRLEALLHERFAAGPRFQVINLGYNGNFMTNNFPPYIGEFFAAARPHLVIIDNLINAYYQERGVEAMAHILGFWRYRSPDRPGSQAAYLTRLAEVIATSRAAGARVAVVEPAMDFFFLGENLLARWQAAQTPVVRRHGATPISLQELMDQSPQRLIYYEYEHPSRLGHELIARRVFEALLPEFAALAAAP